MTVSPTLAPTESPTLTVPQAQGLELGFILMFFLIVIFVLLNCCACAAKVKNNQRAYILLERNLIQQYDQVKQLPSTTEEERKIKTELFTKLATKAAKLKHNGGIYADMTDGFYIAATDNKASEDFKEFMFNSTAGRTIDNAIINSLTGAQQAWAYIFAMQWQAYFAYWISVSNPNSQTREFLLVFNSLIFIFLTIGTLPVIQYITANMGGDTGVIKIRTDEEIKKDIPIDDI